MTTDTQSNPQTTAMIMSFIAAVFVLDLWTPLGVPYWLLYAVPFFFIRYITRQGILRSFSQARAPCLLSSATSSLPEERRNH
jgi:hypothetical protein